MSKQINQSLREWMDIFMHHSMHDWGIFAKSTGLSISQLSIMMQLHYKGTTGMSEITERLGVTAAAASQLVDKLVQSGYLERTEDPDDRRAKLLRLTKQGSKIVIEGIEERYRWMENLSKSLNAQDAEKVMEGLEILTEAAKRLSQKEINF